MGVMGVMGVMGETLGKIMAFSGMQARLLTPPQSGNGGIGEKCARIPALVTPFKFGS
jgi:hypothetical protein